MFDPDIIKNEFLGLVGIRQTNDPDLQKYRPTVVQSGSALLINHPLVNAENIELNAKNFSDYNYPVWSLSVNYKIADRVKDGQNFYTCKIPNNGNQPSLNLDKWEFLDLLSLYLEDIFKTSSEELVNELFNLKRDNTKTKTLIQSVRFYEGLGSLNDKILNTGKLVGVMIEQVYSQNIVSIVERIGLQLTEAAADIPIYVYHSSQPQPIATFTITQTVAGGFQWHNPTQKIKLHNLNQTYDAGGTFFIMYDQNQLSGAMAINKRVNFHLAPCGSCSPYNGQAFIKITRYISLRACSVNLEYRQTAGVADPLGVDLWDVQKTNFDYEVNWGLNFDFTVRCDLTEFIIRQKDVFAYALRDAVTVRLLDDMVNSTRKNSINTQTSQLAQVALSSEKLGGGGLREKMARQIKNINFEFSDLDQVCMPCSKDGGIRVTSFSLNNHSHNLTGR